MIDPLKLLPKGHQWIVRKRQDPNTLSWSIIADCKDCHQSMFFYKCLPTSAFEHTDIFNQHSKTYYNVWLRSGWSSEENDFDPFIVYECGKGSIKHKLQSGMSVETFLEKIKYFPEGHDWWFVKSVNGILKYTVSLKCSRCKQDFILNEDLKIPKLRNCEEVVSENKMKEALE